MESIGLVSIEEHIHDGAIWIAVRARGAEWSWLRPEEAARLGREWLDRYGDRLKPEYPEAKAA